MEYIIALMATVLQPVMSLITAAHVQYLRQFMHLCMLEDNLNVVFSAVHKRLFLK
jgi:hypothetical protein